ALGTSRYTGRGGSAASAPLDEPEARTPRDTSRHPGGHPRAARRSTGSGRLDRPEGRLRRECATRRARSHAHRRNERARLCSDAEGWPGTRAGSEVVGPVVGEIVLAEVRVRGGGPGVGDEAPDEGRV